MEQFNPTKHWEIIDEAVYADGTRQLLRPADYNTVVNNCSVLLAALVKVHGSGLSGKNLYWAVGTGGQGWSDDLLPTAVETTTELVNEIYRKAIPPENISFIDAMNNVSQSPTNRLQLTLTFNEDEANGALMEMGLFGGSTVTGSSTPPVTGILMNHKIHAKINKTNSFKLSRTIRLTF